MFTFSDFSICVASYSITTCYIQFTIFSFKVTQCLIVNLNFMLQYLAPWDAESSILFLASTEGNKSHCT